MKIQYGWIESTSTFSIHIRMLGKQYAGMLISDFLAAYNQIQARQQHCLVHLLRLIKKWQV